MTEQDRVPEAPVRVIIAEDESIIRLDLKETLVDAGYDVVGDCGRGDEAVELVRALMPDVAILDIKMPGLDGLSAARLIHDERLTAVVVLTAFSQRDLVKQASDAGVQAYLVKPFQRDEIVPAVELAIARHAELLALVADAAEVRRKLEDRKTLDRAKGRLMDREGLTEADAYRHVQQRAMAERRTMRDIAQEILDQP